MTENNQRSQRDLTIDALKCFAISMVVLGHAIVQNGALQTGGANRIQVHPGIWLSIQSASNPLLSIAYSFHMPLFAFVSGLVLWRQKSPRLPTQLIGRFRGLVIPYFSWFVVIFCLHNGFFKDSAEFVNGFKSVATNTFTPGSLWYLYSLFICSVVVILLARLPKYEWILIASCWALPIMMKFSPTVTSLVANLQLKIYTYVVLGYLVAPRKEWIIRHRGLMTVFGGTAFAILAYLKYPFHVPSAANIKKVISVLKDLGVPATQFALVIPKFSAIAAIAAIYPAYSYIRYPFLPAQAWIGQRTLGIYATHSSIQVWLVTLGVKSWVLLFGFSLLLSIGITFIIEQLPCIKTLLLGISRKR